MTRRIEWRYRYRGDKVRYRHVFTVNQNQIFTLPPESEGSIRQIHTWCVSHFGPDGRDGKTRRWSSTPREHQPSLSWRPTFKFARDDDAFHFRIRWT